MIWTGTLAELKLLFTEINHICRPSKFKRFSFREIPFLYRLINNKENSTV